MFKDYDKYLSQSLKMYLFVLVIIFIMKLGGIDYFGLDLNNNIIINISNYLKNNLILRDIIYFVPLWFNLYVIVTLVCNEKSARILKYNLITSPIYYVFEVFKIKIFGSFAFLGELLYSYIICKIYNKEIKFKKVFKIVGIMIFFEILSMLTRYRYSMEYVTNDVANLLLSIDYIIILIIMYKLNFMKGDKKLCYQDHQCSSLLKQANLKKSLTKLQENLHNFKKLDKVSKITFIIYFILSLIWNILTLVIVLLIARLNDTFIECIFILTSFWLSKRVFGKAFHLSSMSQCFIISNLTYYVLNRITTPLGISILIPIMLGVGLSYFTSKLVKKTYKPLYKGMPKELFEETILKVVDKDSDKYKICYDYFINKKSALYLSGKYNYTEAGIRKIKDRVNDKIKELK